MISAIWHLILKYEFWVWFLLWLGLTAGEWLLGIPGLNDAALVVALFFFGRLAYHPMWKRDEQVKDE